MRVIVLGGTGLISTAIVERLLQTGHTPILFNRGQTPPRFQGQVEQIHGDRADFADFKKKMAAIKAEAVIDMITFDADTAHSSIAAFDGRISHYLFCSTVCVYGGPLTKVPAGDDEPHRPVSGYGTNKSLAEAAFMAEHHDSGFPVTIFRPSHCYGPGRPLLDIWGYNGSLVTRVREGKPLIVSGDGYGLWQPGLVSDVAKGFVGALGRAATKGKAYNIVGNEIMTWREFHERMAKALGLEANIVTLTTAQILAGAPREASGMLEEIFQFHAAYSNARLKKDVPEFSHLTSWEDGVRQTVAWMDEAGAHQPSDRQPWIDTLAERERAFRLSLGSA
ncbi:MAG: NAD-dependent epimerase/dehydratase family protein [Candidatus Hydrogenedentes bacterium]|nr:NAD-dependent epimerase/dehydratase family protein [Candidatus Hydrogenedentota bacterium]